MSAKRGRARKRREDLDDIEVVEEVGEAPVSSTAKPRRQWKYPYLKTLCRSMYDLQKVRIQIRNRLGSEGKDVNTLTGEARDSLLDHYKEIHDAEKAYTKTLRKELANHRIFVEYLDKIPGCGPMMSGMLISELDDIGRFATVSKLWSYCGYGLVDGRSQKRTKGEQANWNNFLKTKLFVLAGSLLKQRNEFYSKLYNDYKHRIQTRKCPLPATSHNKDHPEKVDQFGCTDGHRHNMAMRYMIKQFLKFLYLEWYKIDGLTPRPTYQEEYLHHKHEVAHGSM